MEKETINIGIIGTQFMGKAHSNAYRQVSRFFELDGNPVLHTACGQNTSRLERLKQQFDWKYGETDYQKLIESDEIDLIDICASNNIHHPIAMKAAKAGKHLLCEKPMAMDKEEAKEMYKAAIDHGIVHMMIFNYRFVPAIALAKQMINEGKIGEVRHFNAVYYQDWLVDPSFPFVWRHDAKISGTGAHGDMSPHIIDLARFLVDEFDSVVGDARTIIKERPIPDSNQTGEVTTDDTTAFMARFQNGAMGSFCTTRFATGRKNFMRLELFGSKGSIIFNLERMNELQYFDNTVSSGHQGFSTILATDASHPYIKSWWPPGHIIGWEHTFIHQFSHLLNAISKKEQVLPDFYDGVQNQIVLDAVMESAEKGKWITIEKFDKE